MKLKVLKKLRSFVHLCFFSLWGGPAYTKSGIVILSTRWQSNIHYILQDLVHYSLAAPDVHTRECRLDGSLYCHLKVAADRLNTILEALTAHLMLHHLHEEPEREIFTCKKYLCYYPQWLRDSLSPVCGIFF